jgi:hypothetical protein
MLAGWAKKGFVVVTMHHTDGSSSRTPQPGGPCLWYQKPPPFTAYDKVLLFRNNRYAALLLNNKCKTHMHAHAQTHRTHTHTHRTSGQTRF